MEEEAGKIDLSKFDCMNLQEEFEYVNVNLEKIINKKGYDVNLSAYTENLGLVSDVIRKLDSLEEKQFLHKDIWPWNIIESEEGLYLIDFNDWGIGDKVIDISVAILEFGMFKSSSLNKEVVRYLLDGYKSIKKLTFDSEYVWETILFICYLYFAYNVIQADTKFESEIYLKRINTLIGNPDIFDNFF